MKEVEECTSPPPNKKRRKTFINLYSIPRKGWLSKFYQKNKLDEDKREGSWEQSPPLKNNLPHVVIDHRSNLGTNMLVLLV